ncbi:hypothetical protein Tco_0746527 [Tanacetum coccineum]
MVNTLLKLYLQQYVSANQHDSAILLDVAQFSYNKEQTEVTRKRLIELVMGRQLLTLNALAESYKGSIPTAYNSTILIMEMGMYEMRVSKRATTEVVTSYDRDVDDILLDCTKAEELLWQFVDKIKRFHEDVTTRTSRDRCRRMLRPAQVTWSFMNLTGIPSTLA